MRTTPNTLKVKIFKLQIEKKMANGFFRLLELQQGRIHDKTVADGWAGAVMQKSQYL